MLKENFLEYSESLFTETDKKSLFNKIIAVCRHLDFHGYFPENVKQGHHLDNVETDYKHIGYASSCDFFITNDKTAKAKAIMAFDLLNINVNVVTPKEFIEFAEASNYEIQDSNDLLDYLYWLSTNEPLMVENGIRYYYVRSFVMQYFNMVLYPIDNTKEIILQKFDSPNRVGTFVIEMQNVLDILMRIFGKPIHEFNKLGDEFFAISWLTENLVLVELKFINFDLQLEIKQMKKMKGWELFKNRCKQKWKLIYKKFRINK